MIREMESFVAGQDFVATDLGKAVKIDATDSNDQSLAVELAGAGELCVGILKTYELATFHVSVAIEGCIAVRALAAVTENAWIKVGTGGKLTPATTDKDMVAGYALSAASAEDEFFLMVLCRGFYAA